MINLAGKEKCDETIKEELLIAKIPMLTEVRSKHTEVPYSIIGVMGNWYTEEDLFVDFKQIKTPEKYKDFYRFVFTRAWYYWVVSGPVPLIAAMEMYADEYGKRDVRVDGHCGCPSPDQQMEISGRYNWAHPYDGVYAQESGYLSVNIYHIDSQIGLNIFADTMRKYGLDKRPRQFAASDK